MMIVTDSPFMGIPTNQPIELFTKKAINHNGMIFGFVDPATSFFMGCFV